MAFWRTLKEGLFPGPMSPQLWDCDPLLVVATDGSVVFAGPARVEVRPQSDGTFELDAEPTVPLLVRAQRVVVPETVQLESFSEPDAFYRGTRRGAAFQGTDTAGNEFTWYVNGAAVNYLTEHGS